MIRVLLAILAFAPAALAQDASVQTQTPQDDVEAQSVRAKSGSGAEIRMLDKVSGVVTDQTLALGATIELGRMQISLADCRYPEDNPTGEAYAFLTIRDPSREATLFEGWMIATSPALNALDHARYDVWVIRCTTA